MSSLCQMSHGWTTEAYDYGIGVLCFLYGTRTSGILYQRMRKLNVCVVRLVMVERATTDGRLHHLRQWSAGGMVVEEAKDRAALNLRGRDGGGM